MSEITHSDELVTKTDLGNFYQTILPYLGGMPEALANKFSRSDIYNTTEKIVGQWIDGKPLYQKVVNVGALTDATTQTSKLVAIGTTVDKYVSFNWSINGGNTWYCGNGYTLEPGYLIIISAFNNASTQDKNKIGFTYNGALSWVSDSYIIVQYTKTTDSATSIGVDTDYSTTEKIVGTWIDGKPIYQKTIVNTTLTSVPKGGGWSNYASISGVDSLVSFKINRRKNSTGNATLDVLNSINGLIENNYLKVNNLGSEAVAMSNGSIATIQYTKV